MWLGNDVGKSGVRILVKEKLCERVVKIRRRSDRLMTLCLIFGEEKIRMMYTYIHICTPKWKDDIQKDKFYDELVHEWDVKGTQELTLEIGDLNGHVGKMVDGFKGVHGE